ncbi:hypothetical protein HHUSO_G23263 [Huso huso]|uniref:TIR domain-containing protein n=1 Tax=Huso huso TaxID=61971 RepID=A0ABR0YWC9_HUSHU
MFSCQITAPNRRCRGYRSEEIAEGLGLIATCEKNKIKMFQAGAIPKLMLMMESGSSREKIFAIKVVWQLAFHQTTREKLKENSDLMKLLEELSKDSDSGVSNTAQGARWVIEKQAEEKSKTKRESSQPETTGHVMISYQWENQKVMLEVNKRLQSVGIKVWMDVEHMAGSTLQAMAEAVEKAYVVVICISPKYKESPNCRTEAEYSFQLRKEMIPLMMQRNYKPDGWLGAVLGTKLWVDFTQKSIFEESMNQLIKLIGGYAPLSNDAVKGPIVPSNANQQMANKSVPVVSTWTKEDVAAWLKENKLDFCLTLFAAYDGPLMHQLQQLRKEAPDFFFKSLRRDIGFSSLTEILQFIDALEKLHN